MSAYGDMPRSVKRPSQEINANRGKAEPNGGSRRPCNPPAAKVPRQVRSTPERGAPLAVGELTGNHEGGVDTNQRMPKRTGGAPQRDPWRK